jgi:hypothetical protein
VGNCLETTSIDTTGCLIQGVFSTILDQANTLATQITKLITEYQAIGTSISTSPTAQSSTSLGSIAAKAAIASVGSVAGQLAIESLNQVILANIQGMVSGLITTASMGNISNGGNANPIHSQESAYLKSIFGTAENWWIAFSTIATIVPESQLVMFSMAKNMTMAYIEQEDAKIDAAINSLIALKNTLPSNDQNAIAYKLNAIYTIVIKDLTNALYFNTQAQNFLTTSKDPISAANRINIASGDLLNAAATASPLFNSSAPDFSEWGKFAVAIMSAKSNISNALSGQLLKVNPSIDSLLAWTTIIDRSASNNSIPGYIVASTIVMLSYFNVQLALLLEDAKSALSLGTTAELINLSALAPACAVYGTFLQIIATYLTPAVVQSKLTNEEADIANALYAISKLKNPYNSLIEALQSLYFQAATGFLSSAAFSQQIDLVIQLFSSLKQYNNIVLSKLFNIQNYSDTAIEGALTSIANLTHSSKSSFIINMPSFLNGSSIVAITAGDIIACLTEAMQKVVPSEKFIIQQIEDSVNAEIARVEDAAKAMIPKSISDFLAASSVVNGLMQQVATLKDQMNFIQCVANIPTVVLD